MMSSMSLPSNKGKVAQAQDVAVAKDVAEADMVDGEADKAMTEAKAEGTSSASAVVVQVMLRTDIVLLQNTPNSTLNREPNSKAFRPLAMAVPRTPRIATRSRQPRHLPNDLAM
jgi:hypothetical protein